MIQKLYVIILSLCIFFFVLNQGNHVNEFVQKEQTYLGNSIILDSSIRADAAILIDKANSEVLFAKNDRKKRYPASTTKIMTALLAIENGNLDERIIVGNEVNLKEEGESTAWLREGQTLTLRELLAGLMLPSGNDAARTIAINIAQQHSASSFVSEQSAIDYFTMLMNEKAKELGAMETNFMNPHGLHHPNHYSTAHDLAIIARAAMNDDRFENLVSQKKFSDPTLTYESTNKLIDPSSPFYYKSANGVKTGYTSEAGYCLVSSAEQNGRELIAVILNSTKESVWNDSIVLLNSGFDSTL
ncbi:D-alanyl-D-alanine carboxypeptidase family protein [Metabacillus sp. YM-086]|uniref:D-alanyl-D-alanine carboxypeptidase family protein n=1 Tax=Metabacillus sp. YM-086 TaxID=3341729 RepID=UPI003A898FB1